jgi:hypothetical protein
MRRVWLGAGVAAIVAVAVVLSLALRSSSPHIVPTLTTSFTHSVVGFGDRVHARAVVVLSKPDDHARVNISVAPLEQLGPTRVTRVANDRYTSLTYDIDAVCMFEECTAKSGRRLVHLPDLTVTIPDGSVVATKAWPALDVRGRVVAADLTPVEPRLRADVTPPPVDYRVDPGTLSTVLTALAALLAAGGVGLAGWQVASLRRERAAWAAPLTELERALALAREAESRAAPDRRRALALLERLLRSRDERLAREARDLAWRSPPPDAEALDELVNDIESKVGR